MRIAILIMATLSFIFMTGAAVASEADTTQIITEVQKAHASLVDYRAHFTQSVTSFGKKQDAAGTLYIKLPGKMRWDYDNPSKKYLITDGAKLWMHLVDEKQVYVQPLGGSANAYLPLQMLTGKMDFSADYEAADLGDTQDRHNLKFTPKQMKAGFKSVTVGIDKKTKRIVRFELVDLYGSQTVVHLSNAKINTGLADSMFSYHETPGVQVIEAPSAM